MNQKNNKQKKNENSEKGGAVAELTARTAGESANGTTLNNGELPESALGVRLKHRNMEAATTLGFIVSPFFATDAKIRSHGKRKAVSAR